MNMTSARLVALLVPMLSLSSCAAGDTNSNVHVVMTTALGDVEIEVFVEAAPKTAQNFLQLVDGGHLNGGTFYRVVSPENDHGSPVISVIQGGIGDAESPLPPIAHESTEDTGLRHTDGAMSMARGGVGTATTEFFICIGDQPALDFGAARNPDRQGFAVFGRVVAGMDVVRAIHQSPADAPTESEYVAGQILEVPVAIVLVERL